MIQYEDDGVGPGEEMFAGEFMVEDDVDGVESAGVDAAAVEDVGGERALQRGESEGGIGIATENELDETVAESADAVVEEDGMGHATSTTLAGRASGNLGAF